MNHLKTTEKKIKKKKKKKKLKPIFISFQLYELSDDLKRKEFLDDLFAFMQKRGSPVNRIPIMAKHVLDLYELYRLVVAKGGLVEVINKKLWREITKGLNLPSSITSAAFTLRTQYMKYLYPYECEKLKMSTPAELQAAIDGNRREGRRPVYGFEYASPTGMSGSGNVNAMNGSSSSSSLNLNNQAAAAAALGLVKSSNFQNDLLNAAGLGHHAALQHHQHPSHHSLLQHPHNPHHHAAFLAAAAAAAAAAAQHNHLYDPSHLQEGSSLHPNHQMPPLNLQPPGIPPFLKPYFEMNTPPTSSSSSSSSSSSNRGNCSEMETAQGQIFNIENKPNIENGGGESVNGRSSSTPLSSSNSRLISQTVTSSSLKRTLEHLDQNNMDKNKFNYELKEPLAKKQLVESGSSKNGPSSNSSSSPSLAAFNPVASGTLTTANSNKMKIKILQNKDAPSDLLGGSDKSIGIAIEINGALYQGTLFSQSSSVSLNDSKKIDSSALKIDLVY